MEILLYSSGERQLKLAIPKMGIKKGNSNIAFVIINRKDTDYSINNNLIDKLLKELTLERDDGVLEGNIVTLRNFGFNETEMKTVTKSKYGHLILEKVAMVDVIK
jgi:tRNA threonylcarbamoyladenosine modification (KEOPS) complex Cgi121 subunit